MCWLRNIDNRVPSLQRRYPPSRLLRTHPPPSRLRSISRLSRLWERACSAAFATGRGGLRQLLTRVLVDVPLLPPRREDRSMADQHRSCCLRVCPKRSAPGSGISGLPLHSLALRPADSLAAQGGFRRWASVVRSPSLPPSKLRGFGPLPRQAYYFLLNAPAFAGRTGHVPIPGFGNRQRVPRPKTRDNTIPVAAHYRRVPICLESATYPLTGWGMRRGHNRFMSPMAVK